MTEGAPNSGGSTTTTVPDTTVPGDPLPVPEFAIVELNPGEWSFDASDSMDNGTIVSYSWDFGDGSTGTGRTALHVYSAPGQYQVRLTVTDDAGQSASLTRQLQVGGG